MNLCIYRAMELIPIASIAIEVTGPLAVALLGSRRLRDFLWIACAAAGLAMLLPVEKVGAALDPLGMAYAAGAALCWALYIVFGKRASALPGGQAVAWGMLVASTLRCRSGSPMRAGRCWRRACWSVVSRSCRARRLTRWRCWRSAACPATCSGWSSAPRPPWRR